MSLRWVFRFSFFVSIGLGAVPVLAQSQSDQVGDEVEQSVLRISWMSGDASLQRGDEPGKWQQLAVNVPMTIGDSVYCGAGAKLELQSPNLRAFLAPETELTALNLTEDVEQLSIAQGTLSVHLSRVEDGDAYEVDTPNAAVTLEAVGLYRFYVDENGNTSVAVHRGEVSVAAAGGEVTVRTGEEMQIDGVDEPQYEVLALPLADSWDRWVDSRERRAHTIRSYDYVSNDIVGVEDLDDNGRWEETSDYGQVWSPTTVAVDWAPYRFGRWIWQDPWGWTWISDEPWGWAPFHYGRWVNRASRWCWVPVMPSVRHVAYAPALVAFVGGGPGWSASVGGGGLVGWFPLGPRDPFVPWWGGPAAANVNVVNVSFVNRGYVTVVNRDVFGSGGSVRASLVRDAATLSEIQRSPVLRGPLPVLPTEASLRVSTLSSRAVAQPAATILTRPVVARLAPPPAPPAFAAKIAAIRGNSGAPLTPAVASQLSVGESRGARAAVPIRPVLTEDRRMTLSPRPSAEGALPPNPAGPPPGRVPAMPERPFIARPSLTRGGAETPGRAAPGAVITPAASQNGPLVRGAERAAPPQPERAVPPAQTERAIDRAPQRVPDNVGAPSERRQPFAVAPRRVAPPHPDPLVARTRPRAQP